MRAKLGWTLVGLQLAVLMWAAWFRSAGLAPGCVEAWPTCVSKYEPAVAADVAAHVNEPVVASLVVAALGLGLVVLAKDSSRLRTLAVGAFGFQLAASSLLWKVFAYGTAPEATGRGTVMGVQFLVAFAAMGMTALVALGGVRGGAKELKNTYLGSLAGLLVLGVMGAIVAVGHTLFFEVKPEDAMLSGGREVPHAFGWFLVLHPVLGVAAGGLLIYLGYKAMNIKKARMEKLGQGLMAAAFAETCFGMMTFVMMAPDWMQLLHLAVTGVLWVVLVAMGAEVMADEPVVA